MDSLASARSALRAFGFAKFLSPLTNPLKSCNSCQNGFGLRRLRPLAPKEIRVRRRSSVVEILCASASFA
jgi:hypothetical protein